MAALNTWPTDAGDGSVANEARWRKMGRLWAPSGVAGPADLKPTLTFPNLTVAAGVAWVDGHFVESLGSQVLTVTANGLAVIRFDPAANLAELLYRDGATVPSQSPSGTWELPIAKLTGSALTDVRAFADRDRIPNTLYQHTLTDGGLAIETGRLNMTVGASGNIDNVPFATPFASAPAFTVSGTNTARVPMVLFTVGSVTATAYSLKAHSIVDGAFATGSVHWNYIAIGRRA
jgi:hypothetical protein